MIPCSYFLDGSCKFTDENCHYSHGEIVSFSSLQEYKYIFSFNNFTRSVLPNIISAELAFYREPDFSNIKMGSRVLTKQKTNTWHRSVVLKLPEKEGDEYRVKFEASGEIMEVDLQNLLPLSKHMLETNYTKRVSGILNLAF